MDATLNFSWPRTTAVVVALFLLNACAHITSSNELRIGSAEIKLEIPAELEILAVNGQPVTSPSKMSGSYPIYLPKGSQDLEIRYSKNWNDQEESGNFIQWRPVLLTANLQAGQDYRLNYRRPATIEQAHAWQASPEIWLDLTTLTSSNTNSNATDKTPSSDGLSEGTSNNNEDGNSDGKSNKGKTTPAKVMAKPLPAQQNAIERLINNETTRQTSRYSPTTAAGNQSDPVLTGLKFYWQQASEQERQQFLNWLDQ